MIGEWRAMRPPTPGEGVVVNFLNAECSIVEGLTLDADWMFRLFDSSLKGLRSALLYIAYYIPFYSTRFSTMTTPFERLSRSGIEMQA